MKKLVCGSVIVAFVIGMCFFSRAVAEPTYNELQEGRYVLVMMNGRAASNTRIPALILDSYLGVVWTCQNLQDTEPLWVKIDLGHESSAVKKKYLARMLEWQDADLRMPAVVLDIEDGRVWTCPNIVDGKATWIEKNLKKD